MSTILDFTDPELLVLSPILKEVVAFEIDYEKDYNSGSVPVSSFCMNLNRLAFATGPILTLVNVLDSSIETEIEFEFSVEVITWDPEGLCVISGDSDGNLHFISNRGVLLYSHRILPSRSLFILENILKYDLIYHRVYEEFFYGFRIVL